MTKHFCDLCHAPISEGGITVNFIKIDPNKYEVWVQPKFVRWVMGKHDEPDVELCAKCSLECLRSAVTEMEKLVKDDQIMASVSGAGGMRI